MVKTVGKTHPEEGAALMMMKNHLGTGFLHSSVYKYTRDDICYDLVK